MEDKNANFCPNCGMKNDLGDVFCGNCGTMLQQSMSTPSAAADGNIMTSPRPAVTNPNTNTASTENHDPEAGKGNATASLVLGIIAVVCWFFGYSSLISVICGFIGITLAGKSKNEGYEGGTRTAGFVLSLIGLIGGALVFVACVACVGSVGMLGASMY